jgi:ribonucleoside-triphosphate reductase (formate)
MVEETTDITLFVRTSGEELAGWNRQRIVDALMRETDIDVETAQAISREVEKQIMASGIGTLTTALIRELVDARLIERGLDKAGKMHARLGFPLYDTRQLILHRNRENANVPHGPEGTNLILAEGIKKEYALRDVFSQDVGDAHTAGDFHLHGLGYIDRPYSAFQSLEYLKKFGLNLPHALTGAKPARHAEVLIAHMVRFGAVLQAHFAGVIAWDAVNISFAPYLKGLSDGDIRQIAQLLIYEFSQLTASRGGQAMFTDIHLYWDIPDGLAGCPAVGPGGVLTGLVYGDYQTEARKFAEAIFSVFLEGDGSGRPFVFPRPIVHISGKFFESEDHETFMEQICAVAAEKGNTCFLFDRSGSTDTDKKRRKDKRTASPESLSPWTERSFVLHNVTINLPRLGYREKRGQGSVFNLLDGVMDLAARAHMQKKDFIERLLSYGGQGPLSLMTMDKDGHPYFRMERTVSLFGMVGLNELAGIMAGKPLHQSEEAYIFGLKVIEHMHRKAEELSERHGMRFVLGQSHAETTAHRFARLDLKYFSPEAGRQVRGNVGRGEIFYSNSTHLDVAAAVDPPTRIAREGSFHPLIGDGPITLISLGSRSVSPAKLIELVVGAFRDTKSRQLAFSPEFTVCFHCGQTSRGLTDACLHCGSKDVDGVARITQYYSRISDWNKGKLAELKDRNRNELFFV